MASPIQKSWRRFLIDLDLARHYPHARIGSFGGSAFRNPVLEGILPSLLHIKAVTVLDEALKTFIITRSLPSPNDSLFARIKHLDKLGYLPGASSLHGVRSRRNDIAHEFEEQIDWASLENDVSEIQTALEGLGLVGPRPQFGFMSERSAARDSTDPDILCHFEYRFWLKEGNSVAAEIKWTENLHKGG